MLGEQRQQPECWLPLLQAKAGAATSDTASSALQPRPRPRSAPCRPLHWEDEEPDLAALAEAPQAGPSCSSGSTPEEDAAPEQAVRGAAAAKRFVMGESPIRGLVDSSALQAEGSAGSCCDSSAGGSSPARVSGADTKCTGNVRQQQEAAGCGSGMQTCQGSAQGCSGTVRAIACGRVHDVSVTLSVSPSKRKGGDGTGTKAAHAVHPSTCHAPGRAAAAGSCSSEEGPMLSACSSVQGGENATGERRSSASLAPRAVPDASELAPVLAALRASVWAQVQGWNGRVAAAPRTTAVASCTVVCLGWLLARRRGGIVQSLLRLLLMAWHAYRTRLLRLT